jgi:ABC-2 type transport system ATP-binding protein
MNKNIQNSLNSIREMIPGDFFYNKFFIPLRVLYGFLIKNKKRPSLRFDVHLADHCNLNCKGCYHFSPLAPEKFLDIEQYERDCTRLNELSMGGGGGY